MARKTQHTIPHPKGGWQNKAGGADRASGRFATKAEAQAAGRLIAINQGAEHLIHALNGQIQNANSYGNDPCPPKDQK